MMPVGPVLAPNHSHARYDPATGLFTSASIAPAAIPDDLTIDQFMFEYTPAQAAQDRPNGTGHHRPSPEGLTWFIDPFTNRSLTFEQVRHRRDEIARVLQLHWGLGGGDAITIYSPNDIDYGPTCWAAFRLGAVVSGANPSYTAGELAYQLGTVGKHFNGVKGLVTHPDSLDVAMEAAKKVGFPVEKILLMSVKAKPAHTPAGIISLDEAIEKYRSVEGMLPKPVKLASGEGKTRLAFLCFSSGTTGLPKAVCIPHASVIANVIQISMTTAGRLRVGSKALATLPYYHIFGLVVVLHATLYQGVTNVVIPKFAFEPILDIIIHHNIGMLFLVPPMVVLMTKHAAVVPRLAALRGTIRDIMVGAAPMTEELVTGFRERFPHVWIGQGYGMTETSTVLTYPPRIEYHGPGSSAGVLVPNVEVKIVDFDNKSLGVGQLGEVLGRSPSNATGYLGNQKATEETFDTEGFVHTGDEGYIDEQGWLYVVDRRKELIKVKGNQVAPAELEGHLLGHPDVDDVCVIGIPDEYAGEVPRAYVVPSPGASKRMNEDPSYEHQLVKDIQKFVSDEKIGYKWLTGGVEFLDVIPKNASGSFLPKTNDPEPLSVLSSDAATKKMCSFVGKLLRRELRDQYKARTAKAKL